LEIFSLLKDIILDILYPDFCVSCGKFLFLEGSEISCRECWDSYFKPFFGEKCRLCGYPLRLNPGAGNVCGGCLKGKRFSFDRADFFTVYSGIADIAIREVKFRRRRGLAGVIGETISGHLNSFLMENRVETVVPVPLHEEELEQRGFNQCEEMLRGAGVGFERAVRKTVNVRKQSSLNPVERRRNVSGIFEVRGNIKAKRVCVFDDVMTTGSTLNEIAKILKQSGAEQVFAYTVARVVKRGRSP